MTKTAKTELDQWRAEALALPTDAYKLGAPVHVLVGEAVNVSRFFETYWDATGATPLKSAFKKPKKGAVGPALGPTTGAEILSLSAAAQQAQTAYVLSVDVRLGAAPVDRARFLVGEISSALEFLFDDGIEDEKDAALAAVEQEHAGDPETIDAFASELEDFSALADAHRAELDGLGGFDAACIDEAKALAATLRARPDAPALERTSPEAKQALSLRNRLLALLGQRVNLVRAAARFVYRASPEIARQATSAYERRRRAASRRKRAQVPPPGPAPAS